MKTGHGSARRRHPGRRRLVFVAAVLMFLLTSCVSGSSTSTQLPSVSAVASRPPPVTSAPGSAATPRSGPFAGLVSIGGGRRLYLQCGGTGSPTVVLLSGAGVAADNWGYVGSATDQVNPAVPSAAAVYPRTAKLSRVCAYDRPGTTLWDGDPARSTPVSQPTTTEGDARDLHALLTAAGIAGPYLLVGHSLGGMIATTYARTYPRDVAGLVLVDPGSQYQQTALPASVWAAWMATIAANVTAHPQAETPDYPASIAALSTLPAITATPAVVLTADQPFDYLGIGDASTYWPQWLEAQELLADSLHAKHITTTDAGHFVGVENPTVVVQQICGLLKPPRACGGS